MLNHTPESSSGSDWTLNRMNAIYFSNEFPKEDLQSLFRRLHLHSKTGDFTFLAQFIHEATLAVKDEIRQLPADLRQLIPTFETIFSWAENHELREGQLTGAVEGVLLVVVQLAIYIGYLESHPDELNDLGNTSLAGLGVGLITSTAVSLSSTLTDLPKAGADAVRLAFRMGIHVQRVSENLEARDLDESPDTWAYVVLNVDPEAAQSELDILNQRDNVPNSGKIFLSAVSRTSVTVSGPPTRLKAIFNKSKLFRDTKFIPLPVFGGLCHASHVYSERDTQSIVRSDALNTLVKKASPVVPLYSTSTGQVYTAKNALELLEAVVSELLTQAIHWGRVVDVLVERTRTSGVSDVALHAFGNSIPLNDLTTALKSNISASSVSIHDLTSWVFEPTPTSRPRTAAQSKLAIVGMSCRLPGGATDTEKFWKILEDGLDVSRKIPIDRFDIETHFDPTGKQLNKSMTQYGCFIDEPGMFDAPFFSMSPREAQIVDPQMRLALVTAYEALEQSGFVGNRTASTQLERVGTYYGQAADDYREVNQGQEVSTYYIPGGCRAFGPGRINYFFKFAGPSYSIDTACSSGLAAIEVACQALWSGTIDTAVTGGLNILTNPDGFAGLCNGHFLTKGHNACKTWDATADGYCRADGIVSLVIKRLEDAEMDNDPILGVILGAGTNHSATAVSITHPHAGHQAYLARQVLRESGVDPLDVSYIELHGTGTQAGDHEEITGVLDVYAPLTKRRSKSQPLHIGAVKSNVGHGESVAGSTSLLKVLIMLQKNAIPPHIGIKTEINPRFPKDFAERNLHIAFEKTAWEAGSKPRKAVVNSFGAAGGNTMMVLEEAPKKATTDPDPRPVHVIAVTAKTKSSLTGNLERLIEYIDNNPDLNLADLSYTTTARRYQHSFRITVPTADVAHLRAHLRVALEKVDNVKPVGKNGQPPVAFAFTGQGASYKSMSLELYRDSYHFRQIIHDLDAIAQGQGFPSFVPALDGSHAKDHAHSAVVTQLALVCSEIALARFWEYLGVVPDVVIGHSLGEYAGLHIAGVLSASDSIFLAGRRAQLLEERCKVGSHTMMAVRASLDQIKKNSAGKPYEVACVNGPSDVVLSGPHDQMDAISKPLEAAGFKTIKLDVAFAFHSEQTDAILEDFESLAKAGVIFNTPKIPVISPLLGKVIFDGKTLNANYLRRATRETVDFVSALESARQISTISDETVWVEIGPHPVCCNFIKTTIPSTSLAVPSIRRGDNNWKTLAESMSAVFLAGVAVRWDEFHKAFESQLRVLDLPTYSWSDKNYWLPYTGDWCLTKGNTFYTAEKEAKSARALPASELQTSTVQMLVEDVISGSTGTVSMQSDLMQPDFLAAANGHRMNDCGVVTSSIHADIAYTLGAYLYRKWFPKAKDVPMNVANLVVTKGLVAQRNTKLPQLIRVTISTDDIASRVCDMTWQNVDNNGEPQETFATAQLIYGDANEWLSSWSPVAHLVRGRIEALERMALEGKANRLSHNMAYTLFATRLVDYAEKYRGMQSVIMHELEAFADIRLTTKESGTWTVPPYFIDSVAHLAGFIMNCSDAMDADKNYCVTPGWRSMRFAKPLTPGATYRSYVKMIPTADDPNMFLGDVYIMQDGVIVGMVGGIEFHSYPRILLTRFFSPPDAAGSAKSKTTPVTHAPAPAKSAEVKTSGLPVNMPTASPAPPKAVEPAKPAPAIPVTAKVEAVPAASAAPKSDSITAKALALIANEGALDESDLGLDISFADLGVDSLMSLVLTEKFKSELNVEVSGSLFLDYPTIGDLLKWLEEYYI